jgi:hypothetical protein
MFGNNGNGGLGPGDVAQIEPPSSSSLWGDMFGLSGLIKTITDPALGAHAHAMMAAIIESGKASHRIELKLNALLGALGHDVAEIERRAANVDPAAPALLGSNGANGGRGSAATGFAPDNGAGGHAADDAAHGGRPRNGGANDEPAGARPR